MSEAHGSKMQVVGTRDPQSELDTSHMAVCHPLHKRHPFSTAAQRSHLRTMDKNEEMIRNEATQTPKF